ncbi:MAG: alpha/beta hydrolase [Lentimicrobiaceae bacterium]|nr:alpha/beta hydrolase [Lentimicrobiaceae bacterium]
MISSFNMPQGNKELKKILQIEQDELPLNFECLDIESSFGNTSVLVTGQENKPPLVLIYGTNGCASFALDIVIRLKDDFRIFVIDRMEQSSLNPETILSMMDESYGQWMYEVLAWLNIRNALLLGISFGGFISWKTLLLDERHISMGIFIVPAGFVRGSKWQILWKIRFPLKLYQWLKYPCLVRYISKDLFTDQKKADPGCFAKWAFRSEMAFTAVPLITKEEAQWMKKPVHLIAAEKDVLFPGVKMLKRAKAIFPSLGEVLLLKNSRHVPDDIDNEHIVKFIRKLVK